MAVIQITKANFEAEVLQSDQPVLIDFWATWCGPCQMQAPVIEELAEELTDVKIAKVDIDQEADLAMKYGVMSIPTLMVFKDGEPAATAVGLQSKEALQSMLQ